MPTNRSTGLVRTPRPTPAQRALALALAAMTLTGALPYVTQVASANGPTLDGVISSGEYSDMYVIEDGVFEVNWIIEEDRITFGLRAHTLGWLALAFEPSDGMLDADVLIGYVDSSGTAHAADQYSTGQNGPHLDDTTLGGDDDIRDFGGAEASGWTTIEIERILNTGDAYDKVIPTSGTMNIIWAIGDTDDFTTQHVQRGDGVLTFSGPPPPPPPTSAELDGVVTEGEYGNNLTTYDTGRFELRWLVNGSAIVIAMRAQVTGYVSLGIEPTNRMQGADMVFGWVTAAGVPYAVDAYCTGPTGPHPADPDIGGTYDLLAFNATEAGGWTTVEVKRNLTASDANDKDVATDRTMTVIWAVSSQDAFNAMHDRWGSGTWRVEALPPPPPPPPPAEGLDGVIDPGEYPYNISLDGGRYELHWNVSEPNISLGLRAETTGWVSVGISPTDRMLGADMLFGGFAAGKAYVADTYSTGPTGPHPEDALLGGAFHILLYNATESGGWTTVELVRALDTGDTYDKPLPSGGLVTIVWAVGPDDNIDSEHTRRGTTAWNTSGGALPPPPPPPPPPPKDTTLDGVVRPGEYGANLTSFDSGRYELRWTLLNDTAIQIAVSAHAAGWVALGISPENRMQGADMVMGYATPAARVVIDAYSTGPEGPHPLDTDINGTDDLLDWNASDEATWTTIEFVRNLTTGDPNDKPIPLDTPITVLWAVSEEDDLSMKHVRYGSGVWQVGEPMPPPPPPPPPSEGLDGKVEVGEYEHSATYDEGRYELYWTIEVPNVSLAIRADTRGWVALGISPEQRMKGADMLIGWAVPGGTAFALDTMATGPTGPHPNDTQLGGTFDLLLYNATERGNWTTLEVVRRLATGDAFDKDVPEDGDIVILWAVGATDDAEAEHLRNGSATWHTRGDVPLPPPPPPGSTLNGLVTVGEYEHNLSLDQDRYQLYWTIDDGNGTIHAAIRGQTTGWVALGIAPIRLMNASDMIIGYVTDSGGAFVLDAFSVADYGPHPDDLDLHGTHDLLDHNATEFDGWTTVEFVRNLTTADAFDKPIPAAGEVRIIWAMGGIDDPNVQHLRNGTLVWNTTGGAVAPPPPPPPPPPTELDGRVLEDEYDHAATFADGDLVVHWRVDGDRVRLALVGRTTGWVSIGLSPSTAMAEADMLFGWVTGGVAQVRDAYSTGPTGPHPADTDLGGTDDIIEYNGTEEGGWTTIELVRNLTTPDAWDKPFPTNGTLKLIWAIGATDDWESKHSRVGYGTIDVGTGESEEREAVELWPVHAALMTVGVGLMLAGYAVLRRKKTYKAWFRAHIMMNSVAVAASVGGLLTGFYMIEQSTGVHLRLPHTWIGLVTLVAAVVVLALGFAFRKVKPASKKRVRKLHLWLGWAGVLLMVLTLVSGVLVIVLEL